MNGMRPDDGFDGMPPGMLRPFPPGNPPMSSFPSHAIPLARLQRGQAHPAGPIKFGRVSEASKLKDRGFGFIAPEDGSENVFFHIHW